MSFDNARNGETYTTRIPSPSFSFSERRSSRSMTARNAVSVLPLPVGAAISTCSPFAIAGQPSRCGSVGAGKREANHCSMIGWNCDIHESFQS